MNCTPLRIKRLMLELSEEMAMEYGTEEAARMLERAATDMRRTAEASATRPVEVQSVLLRGMTRRV